MTLIDSGGFGYRDVIAYCIRRKWNLICSHLIHLVLMSISLREITYRQLTISRSPLREGEEGVVVEEAEDRHGVVDLGEKRTVRRVTVP